MTSGARHKDHGVSCVARSILDDLMSGQKTGIFCTDGTCRELMAECLKDGSIQLCKFTLLLTISLATENKKGVRHYMVSIIDV